MLTASHISPATLSLLPGVLLLLRLSTVSPRLTDPNGV